MDKMRWEKIRNKLLAGHHKQVITALMAVVVFTTTYALILPAITLSKDKQQLDCHYVVHQHTDDCYVEEPVYNADGKQTGTRKVLVCGRADYVAHQHDESCYQDGKLVCQLPEIKAHVHTKDCYKTEKTLTCGLEETKGHKHTDSCYTETKTLVCTQPEHTHTDACYSDVVVSTEQKLVCGYEEGEEISPAVWSEPEYSEAVIDPETGEVLEEPQLIRDAEIIQEAVVHHHDDSCYETIEHTERQLTCGMEEHTHDDSCYKTERELTCGLAEGGSHKHSASCYTKQQVLTCTEYQELHTHTMECYEKGPNGESPEKMGWAWYEEDENGNKIVVGDYRHRICGKTELFEHQHDSSCFSLNALDEEAETSESETMTETETGTETETESVEETSETLMETETMAEGVAFDLDVEVEGADYALKVSAGKECGIPAGSVLKAVAIKEDNSDYQDFADQAQAAAAENIDDVSSEDCQTLALFDLSIFDPEGNEIQPQAPLSVQIVLDDAAAEVAGEADEMYAVHFPGTTLSEDGDVIDTDTEKKVSADKVFTEVIDAEEKDGAVSFDAESFSVYAVVYTVDFHYEVDGKTYDFSIAGGGSVSFYELVEFFGVEVNDPNTEIDEIQEFVDNVESITFSSPELVSVSKVDQETTIGAIKDALGLESAYSAVLTEDQIAEIDADTAKAGDWVLISLKPFDTEESLTVTMKNGDMWTVKVTDENVAPTKTISGEGYIIYTKYGNNIYVLRDDGTVELKQSSELDTLGNEYKWKFSYAYTENDIFQGDNGYTYYNIQAFNDPTTYINVINDGSTFIQHEATNTFVIDHPDSNDEDAYAFGGLRYGYYFYGLQYRLPVPLQMNSEGVLTSDTTNEYWGGVPWYWGPWPFVNNNTPTYAEMYIYKQPGSAYEFTVKTEDIQRGTVAGKTKDDIDSTSDSIFITKTNQTSSDDNKTNKYEIKAIPRADQEFAYWTLNGTQLDSGFGATIAAEALTIPGNNAVLEAHFTNKEGYEDSEHSGRDFKKDELDAWLADLKNNQKPLTDCDKTAEVYDYENRIYRVDLSAKSHLSTFDGTVDLGFLLDVSASMKFPSYIDMNSNPAGVERQLSTINNTRNGKTNGELWGLDTGKKYYYITDEETTSTVVCVEWNGNQWWQHDASNSTEKPLDKKWESGDRTYYSPSDYYTLREAGDPVTQDDLDDTIMKDRLIAHGLNKLGATKTRAVYLEYSTNRVIQEMRELMNTFALSGSEENDKPPKVAYNEFCGCIQSNDETHRFQSVLEKGTGISFSASSYAGGTSTDIALLDASGVSRLDIENQDNGYKYNLGNQSKWKNEDNNVDTTIVPETRDTYKGFQWDTEAGTKKYVILITDGAPQRSGHGIPDDLITAAKNQLPTDSTLITVGLSMKNVTRGSTLLYNIASRDKTYNRPYFYEAEQGSDLLYVIYDILRTTIKPVIVVSDIDDTINEAFYPVDKRTGNPLGVNDWIDINGNKVDAYSSDRAGQIAKNEDGLYTVHWGGQNVDQTSGWHGTVYVKAKEDLIGANAAKTNEGDATIQATGYKRTATGTTIPLKDSWKTTDNGGKATLASPKVNVNELTITNNSTEWTVYLGEEVDPLKELEGLYNNVQVKQVIKDGGNTDEYGIDLTVTADTDTTRVNTNMSYGFPETVDDERSDAREFDGIQQQSFSFKTLIKKLYAEADASAPWKQYFNNDGTPQWDKLIADYYAHKDDTYRVGIQIPYNPYGIDGDNYISLLLDIEHAENEPVLTNDNMAPHNTAVTGKEVEKYTLTVKYDPDYTILPKGQNGNADIADFHVGNYESHYQGTGAGREDRANTHIINVYSKPLDILKADEEGEEAITTSPATFELLRAWKDGVDTDETRKVIFGSGDYADYKLNGADLTGTYYLVDTQTTDSSGIAHFGTGTDMTKLLNNAKDPYIVIEKTPPQGYAKDVNAKTITIVNNGTGMNLYSDLAKAAIQNASYPNANYPYNWNQAVQFMVTEYDEQTQADKTAAVIDYVNKQTGTPITFKSPVYTEGQPWAASGSNRDPVYVFSNIENSKELIRDDLTVAGVFRIKFLDGKIPINIDIIKVEKDKETVKLPGAVFELRQIQDEEPGNGGIYQSVAGTNTQTSNATNANGETGFTNLSDGYYELTEKTAPVGYVKTDDETTTYFKVDLGTITWLVKGTGKPSTWAVRESVSGDMVTFHAATENADANFVIENEPGAELPATGGPGTRIFYLLGVLLATLAGTAFVMRRRMRNN